MTAHIVGGGFGGLAAAALLIRNAGVSGADITIYEADEQLGGGFFLEGSPERGYNLPGSVFDKEFRCAFDLLATIPSAADPKISVRHPRGNPPAPKAVPASSSGMPVRTLSGAGRTRKQSTVSNCFWRAAVPIYSPFVRLYSIYTDPRQMSTFAFEKEHFDAIQTSAGDLPFSNRIWSVFACGCAC